MDFQAQLDSLRSQISDLVQKTWLKEFGAWFYFKCGW